MSTFLKSKDSLGLICKLRRWPFVILSRRVSDLLCFNSIFSNFCFIFLLLLNGPIKISLYFWHLYRKKKTVKKIIKFFASRTFFLIAQSFYEKKGTRVIFSAHFVHIFQKQGLLGSYLQTAQRTFCTSVTKSFWFSLFRLYFQ